MLILMFAGQEDKGMDDLKSGSVGEADGKLCR